MKCDICRIRNAVIFVQQVSRDNSVELHLCEQCASERGFSTTQNKIDISLGGLFSEAMDKKEKSGDPANICPVCGCTIQDIRKHKKTGCAECYRHFTAEIISLLRQDGVEYSYTGTLPEKTTPRAVKPTPEQIKHELHSAIERENYELAAYYRDRLKAMEQD
ncbi:MAG TPA: DNA helicase UvrBC [Treponema sp.]|nr:DNA helicase UvrBC [Treponema sp.]